MPNIFEDLIWKAVVAAALKLLFAAVPWLGWGPIGWIVWFLANKFAEMLFQVLSDFINFEAIVIKKHGLAKEYATQSILLKNLADSKGIDSDEFKAQREKAKLALSKFIQFGA